LLRRWLIISLISAFIISASFLLDSCKKQEPFAPTQINFVPPPGFPSPVHNFGNLPLTEEGVLLGKKLFYDGRLSRDGNFSCASCHQPEAAFTTFEHDRSHGFNNSHTLRNAPGLFNLAWYPYFNWDGSEADLATLFKKHIEHPNEMGEHLSNVIKKIEGDPQYRLLFRKAFSNSRVTSSGLLNALSQFVINLVSANSKYDKVVRGESSYTPEEQSGYSLFKQKCASCHTEPLFTDFSFRNAGLKIDPLLNDAGRMSITGRPEDSLKFRVPSLRNVEFTSYYTHDGRLSLPRHMLWHYRSGIQSSATLDPMLAGGINLTTTEENNLVAFMRTLSDSSFLNNPKNRE
jgi:cytochrome c peroxidase